jgi:TetR/AcrR family fatty acid metabolism transcriptional regulator
MARTADREARRAQLVSAAASVLATQGIAETTVSDVVKAAGVAQGTFYLYFESKDDVVVAVAEYLAETVMRAIKEEIGLPGSSAADEIRALSRAFADMIALPGAEELVTLMHAPGNRAIHDRLTAELAPGLVTLVEQIIERGVEQGVFDVPDAHAAAWFVLGGLQTAELSGIPLSEQPAALMTASELALRALGYVEDTPDGLSGGRT